MLQKRLEKLQQEKVEMENALEQEQEAIVNRLHRQMEAMSISSVSTSGPTAPVPIVPSTFNFRGSEPASPGLIPSPGSLSSSMKWRPGHHQQSGSDVIKETFVEVLKSEVHSLRIRNAELERECKIIVFFVT